MRLTLLILILLFPVVCFSPPAQIELGWTEEVNELSLFLEHLAMLESSGNYEVSKGQYWGRYQIGTLARKDLKIKESQAVFLKTPELQDSIVVKYMQINKKYLKHLGLWGRAGSWHDSVYISEAALLAGAHLVGASGLNRWFNGEDIRDGNEISPAHYMTSLGGYEFPL